MQGLGERALVPSIATATLAVAVAYNAVITMDVKVGGVPIRMYLLAAALVAWALHTRPWSAPRPKSRLALAVVVVAIVVPLVWLVVAFVRHQAGDSAQRSGMTYAATEASHFLYLLLFFPLVWHFTASGSGHPHRLWLWPVLLTCGISIAIWLAWVVLGYDYGSHQVSIVSGVVGDGPGGYRVALVTQVLLIPALAVVLSRVAGSRLTPRATGVIMLLLATAVVAHTRGYWLGLLVVAIVLIVLVVRWPAHRRMRAAVIVAILIGLAASQVVFANGPSPTSVAQVSISQRLQEANELLRGVGRHVLLGSGLGATLPDGYRRSPTDPWSFELTYYQLLLDVGIVGLVAVLSLPLMVVWQSFDAVRAGDSPQGVGARGPRRDARAACHRRHEPVSRELRGNARDRDPRGDRRSVAEHLPRATVRSSRADGCKRDTVSERGSGDRLTLGRRQTELRPDTGETPQRTFSVVIPTYPPIGGDHHRYRITKEEQQRIKRPRNNGHRRYLHPTGLRTSRGSTQPPMPLFLPAHHATVAINPKSPPRFSKSKKPET